MPITSPATTPQIPEGWRPNVVSTFDPDDQIPEALIITCTSRAGEIEGDAPRVLVPYVKTDAAADFIAEGAPIPVTAGAYDQVAIDTHKVSVLSTFAREVLEQPQAATRIVNSMRRSIVRKADQAFLSNASGPAGLLTTAGIVAGGDIGGSVGPDIYALYDAIAAIENDGGQATNLLMNPLDWAKLARIPMGTGSNVSLLADAHNGAERILGGLPVTVHPSVTVGKAIVIDKSEVVSAYGQLHLDRSDHAFFANDAIAIRATWRIGWAAVRPSRIVKLTVAAY